MVILEEYHLLSADSARVDIGKPTLCTQMATAGKRNIRFVFSNQLLSPLPEEVLGNVSCRIVMRMTNPKCLWIAQRSMGLTPEQAAGIPELGLREAVVQYGDYPAPFKVRVDELSFPPPPDNSELELVAQAFLDQTTWTRAGAGTGHYRRCPEGLPPVGRASDRTYTPALRCPRHGPCPRSQGTQNP
jgi:hypothetical protein